MRPHHHSNLQAICSSKSWRMTPTASVSLSLDSGVHTHTPHPTIDESALSGVTQAAERQGPYHLFCHCSDKEQYYSRPQQSLWNWMWLSCLLVVRSAEMPKAQHLASIQAKTQHEGWRLHELHCNARKRSVVMQHLRYVATCMPALLLQRFCLHPHSVLRHYWHHWFANWHCMCPQHWCASGYLHTRLGDWGQQSDRRTPTASLMWRQQSRI